MRYIECLTMSFHKLLVKKVNLAPLLKFVHLCIWWTLLSDAIHSSKQYFYQNVYSLGIKPMSLTLLVEGSTHALLFMSHW